MSVRSCGHDCDAALLDDDGRKFIELCRQCVAKLAAALGCRLVPVDVCDRAADWLACSEIEFRDAAAQVAPSEVPSVLAKADTLRRDAAALRGEEVRDGE